MTMRSDDRPGQEDAANATVASPQMKAALQRFIDDFSQHSRKNAEIIEVLIQALKGVNQELQKQKVKTHLLDARLKKADAQLGELTRVVAAFRRQGWVQ